QVMTELSLSPTKKKMKVEEANQWPTLVVPNEILEKILSFVHPRELAILRRDKRMDALTPLPSLPPSRAGSAFAILSLIDRGPTELSLILKTTSEYSEMIATWGWNPSFRSIANGGWDLDLYWPVLRSSMAEIMERVRRAESKLNFEKVEFEFTRPNPFHV
ncbi:hypothetical protein PFISCL1PPCAC_21470, partial [Pristionchus fissidentatus]